MPLPSPVTELPDIQPIINQAQARARALTEAAWATFQQPTLNEQKQAQAAAQEQQAQIDPRQMALWGQPTVSSSGAGFAPSGNYTGDDFAPNVPRSLIQTESGGNWAAENDSVGAGGHVGHFGILQFGPARMQDAINAGVLPRGMTPEQFKANRADQIRASNWHFSDIDQNIMKSGLDRYLGQNVGGVVMTPNGMRAMAHLGGFGGLQKYLQSGGKYDPADDNGTTLSAYARTHAG